MAVNPLNIFHVEELINVKSRKKYVRYWKEYCEAQEISEEKPASSETEFAFLKSCKDEREHAPTTMWTIYSCLNKFCQLLYDLNLNVSNFYKSYTLNWI